MEGHTTWIFENARREAEVKAADKEKVAKLLVEAARKAEENKGRLRELWDSLQALFRLLSAWLHGRYRNAPWRTIVFATGAIIYFLNPLDVFPDLVPFVGYLDDAGVVAFVISSIRKDLDGFLAWEQANAAPTG